jgi:hypothetical protein
MQIIKHATFIYVYENCTSENHCSHTIFEKHSTRTRSKFKKYIMNIFIFVYSHTYNAFYLHHKSFVFTLIQKLFIHYKKILALSTDL